MKKFIPILCVWCLFITCKKENNNINSDMIGEWSLYSWEQIDTGTQDTLNVLVSQCPCMSSQVLQIGADSSKLVYSGKDTCEITPAHANTPQYFGFPGQPIYDHTWSRQGNNVEIAGEHFVLSVSNGKSFLTARDSLPFYGLGSKPTYLIMLSAYVKLQ